MEKRQMFTTIDWYTIPGLAGLAVALLSAVCVAGLVIAGSIRGPLRRHRGLLATAVGGITFQVVHFVEHVAQLGYWLLHPSERPWLTPWADVAGDGLAYWCAIVPGQGPAPARGIEALHLAGNVVFWTGVMALWMLVTRRHQDVSAVPGLRLAVWTQTFHVAEHILLTATLLTLGYPAGISTAFGQLDPAGTFAGSYRVLFHFAINLIATLFAVRATKSLHEQGLLRWPTSNDFSSRPLQSPQQSPAR